MDAEQRLTDALRAQAAGGAWHGADPARPEARPAPGWARREVVVALAVALVVGILVGVGLGLVSVLLPGVLPPVG